MATDRSADPAPRLIFDRAAICSIAIIIAASAAWLSLSRLQHSQNADSIVPSLISLQHWTPFFWDTNRYGMLIAVLAIPVRNPLGNLILQAALSIFAAFAASFLLLRYFFPDSLYWLLAAALQNIWLLLLVPAYTRFDWLVVQCYGTSFCLAFAALLLLRRGRIVLACVLMCLSHWVNIAGFVLIVPLVLQRHFFFREKRGLFTALWVTALGAIVGRTLMNLSPYQTTPSGFTPVTAWPEGWLRAFSYFLTGAFKTPALSLWLLIPAGAGLALMPLWRSRSRVLLTCLAFLSTALFYGFAVTTLEWVRTSSYAMRFFYPSILLLTLAAALLVVAPGERSFREPRRAALLGAALLFAAVLAYGRPSPAAVRQWLFQRFGTMTADIVQSRATLVAGNYWTVWPAVFETNLTLYEQGDERRVYGLTYRYQGTADRWSHHPGLCIDVPLIQWQQKEAETFMHEALDRPYQLTQTFPTVAMYCEQ